MPSGLQNFAEMQFEGGGSQSVSIQYLAMVAQVAGDVTGDEQCLQLAKLIGDKGDQPQQQPQQGVINGAA
jgi:hypothetical protein